MNIAKDIEKLEKEYLLTKKREEKKLEKNLNKRFLKKLSSLKKKAFFCNTLNDFGYVFDKKTQTARYICRSGAVKGCRKWSNRKDWIYVSVETYESRNVYTDSGWGDYDEFAFVHVKKYFRACPFCGKMFKIAEEILDESSRWCRVSDVSEIKKANSFIPIGFDTYNGITRLEKPRRELLRK